MYFIGQTSMKTWPLLFSHWNLNSGSFCLDLHAAGGDLRSSISSLMWRKITHWKIPGFSFPLNPTPCDARAVPHSLNLRLFCNIENSGVGAWLSACRVGRGQAGAGPSCPFLFLGGSLGGACPQGGCGQEKPPVIPPPGCPWWQARNLPSSLHCLGPGDWSWEPETWTRSSPR